MTLLKNSSKPFTSLAIAVSIAFVAGCLSVPSAASAAAATQLAEIEEMKPVPGGSATPDEVRFQDVEAAEVATFPADEDTENLVSFDGHGSGRTRALQPDIFDGVEVGAWSEVGETGIEIAVATDTDTAFADDVPDLVVGTEVESARSGDGPLVFSIETADGSELDRDVAVRVPGDYLEGQYGADFASRTRWVETVEGTSSSKTATSYFDPKTADSTVLLNMSSSATTVTAAATPASLSGTGSFAATPLKEASTWGVSAQTGTFNWSYALRTPPAAAGPQPSVSLEYDSQSVDGLTGSTNNQPSAIGEGWNLAGLGFIERSYNSCSRDESSVPTSGDLCWKRNNAVLSLGGHSGKLVRVGTSDEWKLEQDDGTRVQRLTGTGTGCVNPSELSECWKVTTTDGTQYYFGKNQLPGWVSGKTTTDSVWTVPVFGNDAGEPCHDTTFAASSCKQAWRWNLDYVVDVHANAEAIYYYAETNKYARNGTTAATYTRGGQVRQIQYGLKGQNAYVANAAMATVNFAYSANGRCQTSCTSKTFGDAITAAPTTPAKYPDVPWDQLCLASATSCAGKTSPTFWTTGMLDSITTKVFTAGAYATVDSWALGHDFPATNDTTSAALWLTQIAHQGTTSAATEPATVFSSIRLPNRVWVHDGKAQLNKHRVSSIRTSLGANVAVVYSPQDCTATEASAILADLENNHRRCFPQWWSPDVVPATAPEKDLFNKYVVKEVSADPRTGGGRDQVQQTQYVYSGQPSWRYTSSDFVPTNRRTWSEYAGYSEVEVREGSPSQPSKQTSNIYTFYQGMDGDRASDSGGTKSVHVQVSGEDSKTDSLWFAGRIRNVTTRNGVAGSLISSVTTTPWASDVTAQNGDDKARFIRDSSIVKAEKLSTGSSRETKTTSKFDADGQLVEIEIATDDAGATCTRTEYAAPNVSSGVRGLAAKITAVGTSCSAAASANYQKDGLAQSRIYYDGGALGAAPTKGEVSRVEVVDRYASPALADAHWVTSELNVYDSMGRITDKTDILGNLTQTDYLPVAGAATAGLLQSVTTTNPEPFLWTEMTAFDVRWGVPTSTKDVNDKTHTAAYDGLGRTLSVWGPDRPQASFANSPSAAFTYTRSVSSANAVTTTRVGPSTAISEYELFDGLGRLVQTQTAAEGGGTVVSDTAYDSSGRAWSTNNDYWTSSVSPSVVQFVPSSQSLIPSELDAEFDGFGRTTASIVKSLGQERFRTELAYAGVDRVDIDPPDGGTHSRKFSDSLGQTKTLVEYYSSEAGGPESPKTTQYQYDGRGAMTSMVDPDGNEWTWKFDARGQLISQSDPDSGISTLTRDLAGQVTASVDERNKKVAFAYDNIGRVTAKYEDSVGSTGKLLANWNYDTLAKGELTSSTSYIGSAPGLPGAAYTRSISGYDDMYHPTGTAVSIPAAAPAFGGTSGLTYSKGLYYNVAGQPTFVSLPAQGGLAAENLQTTYNAFGRQSGLSGTSTYASLLYTPIGQLAQITRNGTTSLTQNRGYDQATGAITNVQETQRRNGVNSGALDQVYNYDDDANITSIKTAYGSDAETQCFAYDAFQALTSAWTPASRDCSAEPTASGLGGPAPYWKSYEVDPNTGNRLSAVNHASPTNPETITETYTYPAGPVQPHAVQTVSQLVDGSQSTSDFSYDAAGNTTARSGQTLEYDSSGNISKITYAGGATDTFIYDAEGELLIQASSGKVTLHLGETELTATGPSSPVAATRTYSVGGIPVAERTTTPGGTNSVLNWLSADAQNSASLEVDSSTGVSVKRYSDPFGLTRGFATTWSSTHGYLNAPKFGSSGLTHLGAREYDPQLGRFLSVDPILEPLNPQQNDGYAYASNSPITMSDPMGTRPAGSGAGSDNSSLHHGSGHSSTYVPKPKPRAPGATGGTSSGAMAAGVFAIGASGFGATLTPAIPLFGAPAAPVVAAPVVAGVGATAGAGTGTGVGAAAGLSAITWTNVGLVVLLVVFGLSGDSMKNEEDSAASSEAAADRADATTSSTSWFDPCSGLEIPCFSNGTYLEYPEPLQAKPNVQNEKLSNIVDNLYARGPGPHTGNGTTMDALKSEIRTGKPTGDKFHTQSAQNALNGLNKLLTRRTVKELSPSELLIARSLQSELKGLLNLLP